jgi:hypothetical protein
MSPELRNLFMWLLVLGGSPNGANYERRRR